MLLVWVMKPKFSVTQWQATGYPRERLPFLKLQMKEGFVHHCWIWILQISRTHRLSLTSRSFERMAAYVFWNVLSKDSPDGTDFLGCSGSLLSKILWGVLGWLPCGDENQFSLRMKPLTGYPCCCAWPCNQAHTGSTEWTLVLFCFIFFCLFFLLGLFCWRRGGRN